MIELSQLLSSTPQGPVRPALLASAGAGSFVLALGALAVPRTDALAADGESAIRLPDRQMLAGAGKNLPEPATSDAVGDETEEKPRADAAEIAFAWFAISPVPHPVSASGVKPAAPLALAIKIEAGGPQTGAGTHHDLAAPASPPHGEDGVAVAAPITNPAPPASREHPVGQGRAKLPVAEPWERMDAPAVMTGDAPDPAVQAAVPDRRVPQAASPTQVAPNVVTASLAARAAPEHQAVRTNEAPARQAEQAGQPLISPGQPRRASAQRSAEPAHGTPPRASVMAVLPMPPLTPQIHAATLATVPAAPAPLRRTPAIEQAAPGMPVSPDTVRPHIASAPAELQQGMLDTSRQEWTGKMVEHIEALRAAAPVRETRLSLAPETLGKVDVSIRHEGDRVHVHFTTETPAARQLIADAQPRLSELAEARGLKLGQTSFESGTTGQGTHRDSRNHTASQQPLARRHAHSDSAVGTADDERIA